MGVDTRVIKSASKQDRRDRSSSSSSSPTTVTKASGKQHTRSRSGCHTCRLRRKKCDEIKPVCRACQHLGVDCEYKRPSWWSHPEKRREHKERIKDIIKQVVNQKKPLEKARRQQEQQEIQMQQHMHPLVLPASTTPPSLCHSLPNSETCSDFAAAHARAASSDSGFSPQFSLGTPQDFFTTPMMPAPQWTPMHHQFPHFSPFEVDIKTERTMFMNDVPLHCDSTVSTYNSYQPLTSESTPLAEQWIQEEHYESRIESFVPEPTHATSFQFSHPPMSPAREVIIEVDECDQYLLNHFLENVAGLIFPVLDASQNDSARSDVILPALESNRCYLHCCLSVAAMHLKATGHADLSQIDDDIMRHRHATVSELCEAFNQENDHERILEATLALIFFQSTVAVPDDGLLDIPWHQHFQGAVSLVDALQLLNHGLGLSPPQSPPSFNMTLASWIDIIGSTMVGRVPVFADSYREKIEAAMPSGFSELMGCQDNVMYLISEIACLDSLKSNGMDAMQLCSHIQSLGNSLSLTEGGEEVGSIMSPTGAFRPRQLGTNITALYRLAARIYLCSLVPDYDRSQPSVCALIDQFTEYAMAMPMGPSGFDRNLVWPFLVAGANSTMGSTFRAFFLDRAVQLGESALFGSFGRTRELLNDIWKINDDLYAQGEKQSASWRDVMGQKGWDFLLI